MQAETDILNEYFANQCTINDNGSVLLNFIPKTDASLSHVSVTRLKLRAAEVAISIIFNVCINSGNFPDCWKYAMPNVFTKTITVS